MQKLIKLAIVTIFIITGSVNLKADITVQKDNIENIKVEINYGYFTAVELENEIQGLININTENLRVDKLNNKTIIIYSYKDNLPNKLGKVVITDSNCNKYSLEIVEQKDIKKQKDRVVYIKNSNKEKSCEAVKNQGVLPYITKADSIKYQ